MVFLSLSPYLEHEDFHLGRWQTVYSVDQNWGDILTNNIQRPNANTRIPTDCKSEKRACMLS